MSLRHTGDQNIARGVNTQCYASSGRAAVFHGEVGTIEGGVTVRGNNPHGSVIDVDLGLRAGMPSVNVDLPLQDRRRAQRGYQEKKTVRYSSTTKGPRGRNDTKNVQHDLQKCGLILDTRRLDRTRISSRS